MINTC